MKEKAKTIDEYVLNDLYRYKDAYEKLYPIYEDLYYRYKTFYKIFSNSSITFVRQGDMVDTYDIVINVNGTKEDKNLVFDFHNRVKAEKNGMVKSTEIDPCKIKLEKIV